MGQSIVKKSPEPSQFAAHRAVPTSQLGTGDSVRLMNKTNRVSMDEIAPAASLTHVLDKSEQIAVVVEECAEELSSVNNTLNDQMNSTGVHPGVLGAIEKSEGIENKIQDAAEELSAVNRALGAEINVRRSLEDHLNATREQSASDRHAALHDPLTSLPNRALFNDRLEHGLAQARRHGWMLAVMFIDLDDFKNINDTHGHAAGDQLLQAIAGRLTGAMRADDTVSRHGGDEFLYLVLEVNHEAHAADVADKIRKMISEPCDLTVDGVVVVAVVQPSIGIAIFPRDGESGDALINSADSAMYRDKMQQLSQVSRQGYKAENHGLERQELGIHSEPNPSAIIETSVRHPKRHNALLEVLRGAERDRIFSLLEWVPLNLGDVLCEAGQPFSHGYFPIDAIVSILYVMHNAESAEIAIVGKEGMIGVPLFMGGDSTSSRSIVQNAGFAYRLTAQQLKEEFDRGGMFQKILLRFAQALMTQMVQTAACNRHHSIDQQFCRWLLMSLDRLKSNRLKMTQKLIGNMLGISGAGVEAAASVLQEAGLIDYESGHITVLSRVGIVGRSCECYNVVKKECERLFSTALIYDPHPVALDQ